MFARFVTLACAGALAWLLPCSAVAETLVSVPQKVFGSDIIVEVELALEKPLPEGHPKEYKPGGKGFPFKLINMAYQP